MRTNRWWWIRHSKTVMDELSAQEAARNKRISLIIDLAIGSVAAALTLAALILQQGYYLIPMFVLLLLRSIFWSRHASLALSKYRQRYFKALRAEQAFAVSRKYVIGQTLLLSSIFYVFWFATAFMLPLEGYYGWLFTSVASGFISLVVFKLVLELWHDLGISRLLFFGLQIGAFILTSLPGAITACIKY